MPATEVADSPEKADVIVSDEQLEAKEGAEIIHGYDFEKNALINGA